MFKITFYPDSDVKDFSRGVEEYEKLWKLDGEKIILAWEKMTGLRFRELFINAVFSDGISHSHPLSLRYRDNHNRNKSILIHELGHRILSGHGTKQGDSLYNRKFLFLVLYDLYVELYGEQFAKETVAWDSNLPGPEYKEAWDWALSLTKEERSQKFIEMKTNVVGV
jgi:hypothetical protein